MPTDYMGNQYVNQTEADRANANWNEQNYGNSGGSTSNNAAKAAAQAAEDERRRQRNQAEWDITRKLGSAASKEKTDAIGRFMSANEDDIGRFRDEGKACFQREDWDGAITAYTKIVDKLTSPKWKEYENGFRNIMYSKYTGMDGKPLSDCDQVIEEHLNWWKEQLQSYKAWLGSSYFKRGLKKACNSDWSGAVSDYNTAITNYPYDDENLNSIKAELSRCQKHNNTVQRFDDKESQFFQEGNDAFNEGNYGKAIVKYSKAISNLGSNKNKYVALMKRAACYVKNDNKEQAIDDYTAAIEGLSGDDLATAKTELAKLK